MATLTPLSLSDLEARARDSAERARGHKKASWEALADVISEFAGQPPGQQGNLVSESQPWWIESLTVSGFRGVNDEVTCHFETSPGLTVIHGSNGAGKSSLCHALDLALHQDGDGSVPHPAIGTGGKAPLWKPVLPFGGGATPPTTRVILRRPGQQGGRVDLTWGVDAPSRALALNGIRLNSDQLEPWKSALTHRLPVYSYADWERRLSSAKDMQAYLSGLLAFGGLFAAIDERLDVILAECAEGAKTLRSAHNALANEVEQVGETFGYVSPVEIPPWPVLGDISTTKAAVEKEFSTRQNLAVTLEPEPILALQGKFAHLAEGLDRLDRVSVQQEALESALATINDADALDPKHCPVCGTPGNWRSHLQRRLNKSAEGRAAMSIWAASLQALLQEVNRVLALSPALADAEHSLSELGTALCRLQVAGTTNRPLDDETVEAVKAVNAELHAADFKTRLRGFSEANRRVVTARSRLQVAFMAFLGAWRKHGDQLARESSVKDMRSQLRDLETRCSEERAEVMTQATDPLVKDFLTDAGITLGKVKVQRRAASMTLQQTFGESSDANGEEGTQLDMGMLSAGQRNAVILAPALAVAQGGPFAFRVFDDPVHAFDQLRIDRISGVLLGLASTQRVVVMTHDERFKEHLVTLGLCRGVEVDVREIERQPDGKVTLRRAEVMWRTLVQDAERLFLLKERDALSTTIRGLLRQSVDNALRALVVRQAFEESRNADEWLSELDLGPAMTTDGRLELALDLGVSESAKNALREARILSGNHMDAWNRAAHGNSPQEGVTQDEINACKQIGEILWSASHVY